MIQVNLLPDVKQQFIKAKRLQRIIMVSSTLIAGTSLAIFLILLISVRLVQQKQINDLSGDIKKLSTDLKNIPDIDRVLTVQEQLKSLPDLHAKKPMAKRLSGYLTQITPTSITISKLSLNFETNSLQITGAADKLETVNKFVDTLKFTTYKQKTDAPEANAFKDIVLTQFGRDNKGASFQINFNFDPAIFDSANPEVTLIVPSKITTRSETQLPLFQKAEPVTVPGGAQ